MIIAIGSLMYIRSIGHRVDVLCVVLSDGRPEFIGGSGINQYYEVYCFRTKQTFLAFDYEMTPVPLDLSIPSLGMIT